MSERVSPKPNSLSGTSKIGDLVREDAALAAVMTDKATVEIPSPVEGEIVWLGAKIGDVVAVGSDLVRLKVPGDGNTPTNEQALPQGNAAAAKGTEAALTAKPRMGGSQKRAKAESRFARIRHERAGTNRSAAAGFPWGSSSGRREAHRRPGCSPQSTRGRRRVAAGSRHRPGRPHHARGSGRILLPRGWDGENTEPSGEEFCRRHQGDRAAPQGRREDGTIQFAHPAYHLC